MSDLKVLDHSAPAAIPTPPGFPVTWDDPDDARLFWTRERVHYPDQMSPLPASILLESWVHGYYDAAAYYELPIVGPRGMLVNTYVYTTMVPVIRSPEELAARAKRCADKLDAALDRLGALWYDEWLPEVKNHIACLQRFDLLNSDLAALRANLEDALHRFRRLAEIHFLYFFPSELAESRFDDLYRDLFPDGGPFGAYRLLQGFDNQSLETGRALWQLSRRALAEPEVAVLLQSVPAAELPGALAASEVGRTFLAELKEFLERHGQRGDKFNLDRPCWVEDPAPVIENLKAYVAQPDRDLAAELVALAADRERLVGEARARLQGYPQPVVDQFENLLKVSQVATVLKEDHTVEIEYRIVYEVRRVLLEFGRRFTAAGVLASPEDVFYLTLDELRETVAMLPTVDRRALASERRVEQERFSRITPPPALGTLPAGRPPDSEIGRALAKGFGVPPRPSSEPGVLCGNAGSPGVARGPAKVVRLLSEAGKLRPGDVLVAETTMPPWTPLFATVAAVVTDVGGILSHCAVVAREYSIPAVVGTGGATNMIRDGQLVEVDGDAGVVRIISAA